MKISFSLGLTLVLAGVGAAQSAPPAPSPWLASRGTLSVDEIGALTGARFSGAERARLEIAVKERNAALERANALFSAQLQGILKQGEAQIGARIEVKSSADAEAIELRQMKRSQPARYRELMRRKAKEKAAETPAPATKPTD